MSRCFPFPPPGYERKHVVPEEALIESIKLQREREDAKAERRKERKREKKEKKKEKKLKACDEKNYNSHEKRLKDEECNADYIREKREDESEQLEKSGLTEEHGLPVSVLNLCDSSDSTQNSSKKKHSLLSDVSHDQSTVLRFRLPLLRPKVLEASSSQEGYSSTSGCGEIITHNRGDVAPDLCKEELCSTSKGNWVPAQDVVEPAAKSSSFGSGSLDIDARLRDLIENWVPPPILNERRDCDDQEWLFDMSHGHEAKRYKAGNGASHEKCSKVNDGATNGSFSFWPRACYLPEAGVHALPYTIPY